MRKSLIIILIIVILAGAGYFVYTKGMIDLDFLKNSSVLEPIESKKEDNKIDLIDTTNIKGEAAVFFSPDIAHIEEMKKQNEEDFYTIADDANYYFSNSLDFLKEKNIQILNTNKRYLKFTKENNENIILDRKTLNQENEWGIYLFDGKNDPIKINISDTENEYNLWVKKVENKNTQFKDVILPDTKTNTTTKYMCEGKVKIVREQDSPSLPPRVSYLRVSDNASIASYGDFGAYIRPEYFSIDRTQIEQGYTFNEINFCKYLKN